MNQSDPLSGLRRPTAVGRWITWAAISRARTVALVAFSLAVTGVIDHATGSQYAVSPLYLFPVLIASTAIGRVAGIVVAMTAAVVWTLALQSPGAAVATWRPFAWNVSMRFAVLAFVAWLLSELEQEMVAARHDFLTHLSNRRHFMLSLEAERNRSARTGRPYSLLSIDLDGFKMLNDTRGHAVGDEALRIVAAVLSRASRAMDLSARMGGDEFCILRPGADAGLATSIAARLHASASEEFRGRGWPLGLSIGVATATGAEETVDELLRRADDAMYRNKLSRRRGAASSRASEGTEGPR